MPEGRRPHCLFRSATAVDSISESLVEFGCDDHAVGNCHCNCVSRPVCGCIEIWTLSDWDEAQMDVRDINEVSDFSCSEARIGNVEYSNALGDDDGLMRIRISLETSSVSSEI